MASKQYEDRGTPPKKSAATGSAAQTGYAGRPPRNYETGRATRWIRIGTIVATGAMVVATLVLFPTLPDTVPTHFDFRGQPDAWGSRGSVFLLLGILVALVAGLSFLSHHPRVFNYPTAVTDENAQALYRAGEQMMVWMTASILLLFAGILLPTLIGRDPGFLPLLGGLCVVASLALGLVRMFRA